MKAKSIPVCIILSIVTCGIYGIYWFVTLHNDANNASQEQNPTSAGVAVLLSIVTCSIYAMYWSYKQGEKLDKACTMRGLPTNNRSVIYLVLSIFGLSIVAYALMQDTINKFPDTAQQ